MTPAARIAAAIEILDQQIAGTPAERALTNWARSHRFAGAGDRAAIRDHVFDALRCLRSYAALGGAAPGTAATGRQLMLGALRDAGRDPAGIFTGQGHAPAPLAAGEPAGPAEPAALAALPPEVACDCPDWLLPLFRQSLGADCTQVLRLMRQRAPVFLRVNLARGTREAAIAALAAEEIVALPHPLSPAALEVTGKPQRIRNAAPYLDGRVELQDAASQALVDALPLAAGQRVLDYCAGGGGKTLAMAGRLGPRAAQWFAHDADPARMRDLPVRAARAGLRVTQLGPQAVTAAGRFDLLLADVPCSGSGSWRRAPEAKWQLTPDRFAQLLKIQSEILDKASGMVKPGGVLAYATCSLFTAENADRIRDFLEAHPGWSLRGNHRFTPLDGGDGFYLALLAAP